MQSLKKLIFILLLSSCTKQQCPELQYENAVLRKTVQENASQILFMQTIIANQNKTIKRMK